MPQEEELKLTKSEAEALISCLFQTYAAVYKLSDIVFSNQNVLQKSVGVALADKVKIDELFGALNTAMEKTRELGNDLGVLKDASSD